MGKSQSKAGKYDTDEKFIHNFTLLTVLIFLAFNLIPVCKAL